MLNITVHNQAVAPGQAIHGRIDVTESRDVRGIRVELTAVQRSSGGPTARATAVREVVMPAGEATAGSSFDFEFEAPASMTPTLTSPNGSLRWIVRAVADIFGPDKEAIVEVDVRPPPPGIPIEQLAVGQDLEELVARVGKARRSHSRVELFGGFVMIPIGLALLGFAVWAAAADPGGEPAPAWFVALMGIPGLVALVAVWLNYRRHRPAELEGVNASLEAPAVRSGGEVVVNIEHRGPEPVAVQFIGEEFYDVEQGTGDNRRYFTKTNGLVEEWQEVGSGTHQLRYAISPGWPPSFAGDVFRIAYEIRVMPAEGRGKNPRLTLRRLDLPVVVVA